jgi:hypothetical protein
MKTHIDHTRYNLTLGINLSVKKGLPDSLEVETFLDFRIGSWWN